MKSAVLLATGFIYLLKLLCVSAQWDVRESPVIKDIFPDKTFYVSQTLTNRWDINYPCEVSKGTPKPDIYWQWFLNGVYKGKIDSKSGYRALNGTRLSLANINPNETYQCVAENIYGTALSKKLNIHQSETTFFDIKQQNNPDQVTRTVGESLVIKCSVLKKGAPTGTYFWKTNERLRDTERVYVNEKGSLVFTYVEEKDKDTYICNNYNLNLATTTSGGWTELTVTKRDLPNQFPIKLLYATKDNSIAMYGSKFIIQCMYGGIPVPKVEWESPTVVSSKKPYHTLVIDRVTEEHEGCYKCKAWNQYQQSPETSICIDVKGPPIWVQKLAPQLTVTEGSEVVFVCKAREVKGERKLDRPLWMRNGKPLNLIPGGAAFERLSLSLDGASLTFSDVRKSTDICNFQCTYSNEYGEIFADISFNVILKTEILVAPKDQVISRGEVAVFPIEFKVDPLVKDKTYVTWKINGNKIDIFDIFDIRISKNYTLTVNTSQMDEDRFETFLGNYSVTIFNGVETVIKFALLKKNAETGGTTMQSAGLDAKWIALIVALVLFFIIFILLLCILFNRQSGDDYSVDKKERKAGHDPEKELADSGFHDLPRTDDDPGLKKPDNLSISSTGKSIASDTDSMGEYSDNDAGSRFNEDGSFIGAYQSHESKGNESNV